MDLDIAARCLHVLGVVIWIGGVALVTTAVLPAAAIRPTVEERLELFERIERRFAPQARVATLLVGVTGLFLVERLGLWSRFALAAYWWMHAMVGLWAIFMLLLFVLDPFVLHRVLPRWAAARPRATFLFISGFHWMLLTLGLVTIAGAVAGSHGATFP